MSSMASPQRTGVVTGASTGIGFATALALARLGWRVVMVSRDEARAHAARQAIAAATDGSLLDTEIADLSRLDEVRRLAGRLAALPRIDALINNAGALYAKRRTTADGHEMTFALDHLAPFALTGLLYHRLVAGAPARVVNLSSRLHRSGRIDLDDLMATRRYGGMRAYAQAKLANLMFTYELARRAAGTGVTVNAVHPGDVYTRSAQNCGVVVRALYRVIGPLFLLSADKGADTVAWAASAPALDGVTGKLLHRRAAIDSAPHSHDAEVGRRLWEATEALTGVRYPGGA